MVFVKGSHKWAEDLFGDCDLGDSRRVDRLIDYAARQAADPGGSTSRACRGDNAAQEGAYRVLRNPGVDPVAIDEGAFEAVAEVAGAIDTVLAIQDSTGVSFKHPMAQGLAEKGNPTGFVVHSTLLVDAGTGSPIGLVGQKRWIRSPKERPGQRSRSRNYAEKESFKWEAASDRVRHRMDMASVVTVCDREADIYDYLLYQVRQRHRFVVRASADRPLETSSGRLWKILKRQRELGRREVKINQRGGQRGSRSQQSRPPRQGRTATVVIRSKEVELQAPKSRRRAENPNITMNAVLVREVNAPRGVEPLEWMLLTQESVSAFEQATTVVGYYEKRWLIEEFHKAWKSGCRVEHRPLQSLDNLERMMVITSHVAVRLLQLRSSSDELGEKNSCEPILGRDEWECLHAIAKPGQPIPKRPPTARWVLEAIARLGGWQDTKRTGRIGWQTLWHGWDTFQNRFVGWRMALGLARPP